MEVTQGLLPRSSLTGVRRWWGQPSGPVGGVGPGGHEGDGGGDDVRGRAGGGAVLATVMGN